MLETFKARLKAKSTAAGANLSKVRIDAIADRLHKKFPDLTEEKDHDEKLDDLYSPEDLKEFGAVDDHQRAKDKRAADKKAKEEADKKKADSDNDLDDLPADTPAWAKGLIESNKKLSETVSLLQSEKIQGTVKSKAAELLKDVPADFYDEWKLPETEEGITAFAEKVNTKYAAFKQDLVNKGLAIQTPPPAAGGGSAAAPGKVDPAVAAYVEKKKAAEKATATT